jgi:hypothetical protein
LFADGNCQVHPVVGEGTDLWVFSNNSYHRSKLNGITGKLVEVLIQGPLAMRSVEELMDDVQLKRGKLQSQIGLLKTELLQWISKDAETGVRQGQSLLTGQAQIKDDIGNVAHKIEEIGAKCDAIHLQQRRSRAQELEDALNSRIVICNAHLAIFRDSLQISSRFQETDLNEYWKY